MSHCSINKCLRCVDHRVGLHQPLEQLAPALADISLLLHHQQQVLALGAVSASAAPAAACRRRDAAAADFEALCLKRVERRRSRFRYAHKHFRVPRRRVARQSEPGDGSCERATPSSSFDTAAAAAEP